MIGRKSKTGIYIEKKRGQEKKSPGNKALSRKAQKALTFTFEKLKWKKKNIVD